MSTWRRRAIEILPELRPVIEGAESPTALWIELGAHFTNIAPNADDSSLRPILLYAFWCLSAPGGSFPSEMSEAVSGGFFRDLARHKDLWSRFRKWFSPAQFKQMEPAFQWVLSQEELQEVNEAYYGSRKNGLR